VDDVVYISLTEMAEGVRAKKLSPIELVDAHLARISQLNPKLNAFVKVDEKPAQNQILSARSTVCQSPLRVLSTSRAYHANAAAS